jgi:hypothetical protein
MGPDKVSPTPPKNQDAGIIPGTEGYRRRAHRPRRRVCLLKGCGQVFRPEQPMARYCSEACRKQARETVAVIAARVIPIKLFFVLLRPPRLLCGIRTHPAITPAALLFSGVSSCCGARPGARAALAQAVPWPRADGNAGPKSSSSAAMKANRYRPDILHSPRHPDKFSMHTTRRGRGARLVELYIRA